MAPSSSSPPRREPVTDAAIKAGVTAFALGAAMAIHEGHGDPPPVRHESPNPTGRVAIEFFVSSTSLAPMSILASHSFSSRVSFSPQGSTGLFRLP